MCSDQPELFGRERLPALILIVEELDVERIFNDSRIGGKPGENRFHGLVSHIDRCGRESLRNEFDRFTARTFRLFHSPPLRFHILKGAGSPQQCNVLLGMRAADIPEIHDFRMRLGHPRREIPPVGDLLRELFCSRHPFFRFLQIEFECVGQRDGTASGQLIREVVDQCLDALLFAGGFGGTSQFFLVGYGSSFRGTSFTDTTQAFSINHKAVMVFFCLSPGRFSFENTHLILLFMMIQYTVSCNITNTECHIFATFSLFSLFIELKIKLPSKQWVVGSIPARGTI